MKKELLLTEKQDITNTNNVIPFQRPALITGGPTGPEDWLRTLKRGTIFLAKVKLAGNPGDKLSQLILNKFMVVEQKENTVNLIWGKPEGHQLDIWVPVLEFSRNFELIETIGEVVLVYKDEVPEEEPSQK